jgi:hypothetical protein
MRSIDFLEFGPPDYFVDLNDIIKRHVEQDQVYENNIS